MADDMSNNVLAAGITSLSATTKDGIKSLEGIHEVEVDLDKVTKDFYEEAEKAFKDIVELLQAIAAGSSENDNNPLGGAVAGVLGGKKEKEEPDKPKRVNKNITLEQLIKYNDSTVAAAAFLHNDLEKIIKLLRPQKGEKKENGLGKIFDGIGGAGSMLLLAAALVAFAGAALIFSKVDFGKALLGLALFTGFVLGTIGLAKLIDKEQESLKSLAKNTLIMIGAYVLFGVALVVVSNIMKFADAKMVAITLGLFAAFVTGTVALAKWIAKEEKSLADFAKGVLMMIGGYVAFSVALILVSKISASVDWVAVGITLGAFMGFTLVSIGLAKLVNKSIEDFTKFAGGAALMAIAYAAFGLAVAAVGKITKDLGAAGWAGVFLTLTGFVGMILLTKFAGNAVDLPSILKLAAGSLLMTVAFLAFGGAIKALSSLTIKDVLMGVAIVGVMTVLVVALGALGTAITGILPGLVVFSVAAVIMSVALTAFAASVYAAVTMINKIVITKETFATLGSLALFMLALAPIGLAAVASIPSLLLVAAWSLIATPTFLGLFAVLKGFDNLIADPETLESYKVKIRHLNDVIHLMSSSFFIGPKDMLKMVAFAAAVLPVKMAITSALTIAENVKKLAALDINKEEIFRVMSTLSLVIDAMGNYAESAKGIGQRAAKAMNIALGGIVSAVASITDTIIKLRSIKQEEVEKANENLKMIIYKLFIGDGKGDVTITSVFESIPGVSKKALRGAEALVPITQAIDNLTSVILKIKDSVSEEQINSALAVIEKEVLFFSSIGSQVASIGKLSAKRLNQASDNISIIANCLSTLKDSIPQGTISSNGILEPLKEISAFDAKGFADTTKQMKKGAETLSSMAPSLKKIGTAIDNINVQPLEKIKVSFDSLISQTSQLKELSNTIKDLASSLNQMPKKGLANLSSLGNSSWSKSAGMESSGTGSPASLYGETDRTLLTAISSNLEKIANEGVKVINTKDPTVHETPKMPSQRAEAYSGI